MYNSSYLYASDMDEASTKNLLRGARTLYAFDIVFYGSRQRRISVEVSLDYDGRVDCLSPTIKRRNAGTFVRPGHDVKLRPSCWKTDNLLFESFPLKIFSSLARVEDCNDAILGPITVDLVY